MARDLLRIHGGLRPKISIRDNNGPMTRKQSGFTLVELMIAVAIVGILAGISVQSTIQALPMLRLKRAARVLMGQMQQARLNAIKENRSWQINFTDNAGTANDTYQVISLGSDGLIGTADDAAEPPVNLASYGSGVTYGAGNATNTWNNGAINQRASVTFNTRGICTPGTTYITNQDNTVSYAITTSIAGSISLRRYNGMTPFNTNNWMN